MKKDINKMFNLQGLVSDTIDFNQVEQRILIKVRNPRKFFPCPNCSISSKKIHQVKHRQIKHGLLDRNIILLNLKVRRIKCNHCGKVFIEKFLGIDRRNTSVNSRSQLLDWLKTNRFSYIGKKFNIAPSTLVRYLLEFNRDIDNIEWEKLMLLN